MSYVHHNHWPPHFKARELRKSGGIVRPISASDCIIPPAPIKTNMLELAWQLEVIRAFLNVGPLTVISGYRPPSYNRTIKKAAKNSQHMYGRAADIRFARADVEPAYEMICEAIKDGILMQGGVGMYSDWVHYDCRGRKFRWDRR